MSLDIQKVRNETPYCDSLIHFNNAGASLTPRIVNESIINFLNDEAQIGGYEIVEQRSSEISEFYSQAAKLINASSNEIALTDCASTSFSKAIFSIPFEPGDIIITSELEYGNNFLNYLKLKKDQGIQIKVIKGNEEGPIDLNELRASVNEKVKLIAITHMPTSGGAIAPVYEIGLIAKENNILYMIDSCQSVGHFPIDVKALNCDFLNATSRKYLRGPRGLGFLYVNKDIVKKLDPLAFEMVGAEWKSVDQYELNHDISMFETYEKPYAFVIGFKEALKYANDIGIDHIWAAIHSNAQYLRSQLQNVKGVSIHDGSGVLSGIVSFTKENKDPLELHKYLQDQKINSSVLHLFTSLLEMQKKGLKNGNRLSTHYYNTKEEIDKVVQEIDRF